MAQRIVQGQVDGPRPPASEKLTLDVIWCPCGGGTPLTTTGLLAPTPPAPLRTSTATVYDCPYCSPLSGKPETSSSTPTLCGGAPAASFFQPLANQGGFPWGMGASFKAG